MGGTATAPPANPQSGEESSSGLANKPKTAVASPPSVACQPLDSDECPSPRGRGVLFQRRHERTELGRECVRGGVLGAVRTRQGIASNWKREQNWGIGRGQIGGGIIFSYNSVHVVHLSLPTGSIRYRSAGCWAGSFSSLASAELFLWAFL